MNTPDKQQRLQELLLELALPETKITDSNLEQYIFRLQDIYEADFRHLYSGVFGVITRIDADDASDLAKLQENIHTLHSTSVNWLTKKRGHVSEDFCLSHLQIVVRHWHIDEAGYFFVGYQDILCLLIFLDKGCDLSYSIDKRLSSESADKLRSLAYLRRSEAFCLKDTEERGGCNGIILKLETRFIYA